MSMLLIISDNGVDIDALDSTRDDRESDDTGQFQYQYFLDTGSILVDDITDDIEEFVRWVRDHTTGRWAWNLQEERIWEDIGEPGSRIRKLVDVRTYLYISFDLPDDAMLSRMTWQNLKGVQYAHSRRLS